MSKERTGLRCPTCGRQALRRVRRSAETRVRNRVVVVRGIAVEECSCCGERLYDLAALARIRAARLGAANTTAARSADRRLLTADR